MLKLISSNSTKKTTSRTPISIDLNPHQHFEFFFDDEVVTYLCEESKIYAASKGNFVFHVTPDKFCAFLAILLILGYTSLPRRRMYWQQETDVFKCAVADLLPRNCFEEILRYSHLAGNAKLTPSDKLAKVRPFFNLMNQQFLNAFQFDEQLCVDESMIPYFGKYSAKQYIKGKAIKFSFKYK